MIASVFHVDCGDNGCLKLGSVIWASIPPQDTVNSTYQIFHHSTIHDKKIEQGIQFQQCKIWLPLIPLRTVLDLKDKTYQTIASNFQTIKKFHHREIHMISTNSSNIIYCFEKAFITNCTGDMLSKLNGYRLIEVHERCKIVCQ